MLRTRAFTDINIIAFEKLNNQALWMNQLKRKLVACLHHMSFCKQLPSLRCISSSSEAEAHTHEHLQQASAQLLVCTAWASCALTRATEPTFKVYSARSLFLRGVIDPCQAVCANADEASSNSWPIKCACVIHIYCSL